MEMTRMAKRKRRSYDSYLSDFIVIWERDGVEIYRERVRSENEAGARVDAAGPPGIGLFDEVQCRVERIGGP